MAHAFKLYSKRNSGGWRLEGEEEKGFSGKRVGRRRTLIVRINAVENL
jgi:hypothetical protein